MNLRIKKQEIFAIFLLLLIYLSIRFPLLTPMNEYWDYDEGTYLLIARLINQGYLPYRDIFAVHPPFYYYLLALWLRIFGMDYIAGRGLSLLFGALSVLIAYYIGKELKGEKLGIFLALILSLEPNLVHVNTLVMFESIMEPFVLLSIYYLIKLVKTDRLIYAYYSLFFAGFATAVKFIAIPFTVGLFLTINFYLFPELWNYVKNVIGVVLNKKQVFFFLFSLTATAILMIIIVSLYPTEFVRKVFIVPILHEATVVGNIVPIAIFLLIWGFLILYVYKVSYVDKLFKIIKTLVLNIKIPLKLGFFVLLPKLLIEGIFGILVSPSYITQTYGIQGGRYNPVLNFFDFLGDKLSKIQANELEFLLFDLTIILILLILLFKFSKEMKVKKDKITDALSFLFLTSLVIYILTPAIVNERFLTATLLVLYILAAYYFSKMNLNRRQALAITVSVLLFLGVADYALAFVAPQGKLKMASSPHAKELREDLRQYIYSNNFERRIYSINPMNNFYLDLDTVPYYIDNFGLILNGMNSSELIEKVKEKGVNHVIVSTWAYAFVSQYKLRGEYMNLIQNLRANYSILYGDSYNKKGEVIEIYSIKEAKPKILTFHSWWGKLEILNKDYKLINIYPQIGNVTFNRRCRIYLISNNTYDLTFYSNDSKISALRLNKTGNKIKINNIPNGLEFVIELEGVSKIITVNNNTYSITVLPEKKAEEVTLYSLKGGKLKISGKFVVKEQNKLLILKVISDEVTFQFITPRQ